MAIGAGMMTLSSCATVSVYKTSAGSNKISVPVSQFAKTDFQVVQAQGLFYNIALRKETDGSYTALLLRCTHADNQLMATGKGFKCNLHGSTFNQEGKVTKGPAERALVKYPTEVNNGNIIIHLS